ncbi:hypothetical protein L1I30_04930 [Gillisia sp. M10.2A]|uniref:Outer membrane lipoprotein-sorting protein n=1 Tax=Gillisia lutea TaxID=2909668 RepID=A0ABS9EDN9_9FLAO|nr:hypothetical protein [Gillisia lutea]MCF4100999.1 hypothetical protein [Gillisia lutea]
MKKFFLAIVVLTSLSCNQNQKKEAPSNDIIMSEPDGGIGDGAVSPAVAFAQDIEQAHNKEQWNTQRAVSFNIDLSFGGKKQLKGKITSLTNSSRIRIDQEDGTILVYDGEGVYLCPKDADSNRARFNMFTWQYFFALPFKLTDPGTNWEIMEPSVIDKDTFYRGKLTFDDTIGDAPDDWYVVYQEANSRLLHAAAYIVTFGSNKEKAEKNPHAIVYRDYKVIDGIPVATKWTFHNWSMDEGIQDQIGEASISDIIFFNAKSELFDRPENSKSIEK